MLMRFVKCACRVGACCVALVGCAANPEGKAKGNGPNAGGSGSGGGPDSGGTGGVVICTTGDCDGGTPPPGCGDGTLTDDEACDDGNEISGDGCSDTCLIVEIGFSCAVAGEPCQ